MTELRRSRAHAAIFLAALCALLLCACGGKDKDDEKEKKGGEAPTPVMVEHAVRGAIDRMVIADAILFPINQANVTAKIVAPVKRVPITHDDHIRATQHLI